jgi:hypothetical protein
MKMKELVRAAVGFPGCIGIGAINRLAGDKKKWDPINNPCCVFVHQSRRSNKRNCPIISPQCL